MIKELIIKSFLSHFQNLIGGIADGTGDPERITVAQVPLDLPEDHGDGIGGKLDVEPQIKVVDRLDESHATCLKDVVRVGIFRPETLYEGEDEPHVPDDEFFPRLTVSRLETAHELVHLLCRELGKPRRVDAANDYLIDHTFSSRGA